jgi:hypothetical protein
MTDPCECSKHVLGSLPARCCLSKRESWSASVAVVKVKEMTFWTFDSIKGEMSSECQMVLVIMQRMMMQVFAKTTSNSCREIFISFL